MADAEQETLSGIQGIASHFPNSHVGTLKRRPWSDLPNLLGKDGEQIMLDLLLECAVYAEVGSGQGNYYQLSGMPMFDCAIITPRNDTHRGTIDRLTAHGGE